MFYGQTEAILGILHWDMFTSAVEDIPQTVIVLIIIIAFEQFTTIAFLSVSLSITLILSKLVRLAFANVAGCDDNSVQWKMVDLHSSSKQPGSNQSLRQSVGATTNNIDMTTIVYQ